MDLDVMEFKTKQKPVDNRIQFKINEEPKKAEMILSMINGVFYEAWEYDQLKGDYVPTRITNPKEMEKQVLAEGGKLGFDSAKVEQGFAMGVFGEDDTIVVMAHDVLTGKKAPNESKDLPYIDNLYKKLEFRKKKNAVLGNLSRIGIGTGFIMSLAVSHEPKLPPMPGPDYSIPVSIAGIALLMGSVAALDKLKGYDKDALELDDGPGLLKETFQKVEKYLYVEDEKRHSR